VRIAPPALDESSGLPTVDFGSAVLIHLLSAPVAKLISTVYVTVRHPVRALSAIPTNFAKYVLVIDLALSPRAIPGIEETRHVSSDSGDTYRILWPFLTSRPTWAWLIFLPMYLPIIVSAFAYRWAIKSTAIFWLPLIWIVVQSRSPDIFTRLAVVARSYKGRMMFGYSIFVAGAFLVKLTLLFGFWRFPSFAGPLGTAGTQLIDPVRLPLWQAAAAFNAVLASVYFVQADVHLHQRGSAEAWTEQWLKREYGVVTATRCVISLYTIACTFYIAIDVAWNMQWPTIQVVPFPWS
jgi:hypothetical protein